MAESNPNNVIELSVKDCPVVQVTVYRDRAEVCRTVETTIKGGINEVKLQGLVQIEEDSIRVEGKGEATIAEVSYQLNYVSEEDAAMSDKVKELKKELKNLREEEKRLNLDRQEALVKKQWDLLDKFAATASSAGKGEKKDGDAGFQLTDSYFSGMKNFMQQYKEMGQQLEEEKVNIEKKKEELQEKIEKAENNLRKAVGDSRHGSEKGECLVVLEAESETKVNLSVSYVVFRASWYPSYDLRMNTELGMLKIFYYGFISQHTGEDWTNVKLHLSTAEPSVGGSIPSLPISQLSIKKPVPVPMRKAHGNSVDLEEHGMLGGRAYASPRLLSYEPEMMMMSAPAPMAPTHVEITETTTSASYEIARQSTIPSDNTDHKVTVAVLEFKPRTSYVTVPKVVPHAYLQAKVTNTSPYTLLAGKTNIFLDNSFVAKADLKSVAPKEEFECSLGMDPGVRVDYKPLVKVNSTTGLLTKWESISYEQVIEVKNLHDYDVDALVRDNLPRSMDEKIKVNLLQPHISEKHPEKGVTLTKNNHVEWELKIPKLGKQQVVLKYTVEHPKSESIETSTAFASD